jgi:hypothetical protein
MVVDTDPDVADRNRGLPLCGIVRVKRSICVGPHGRRQFNDLVTARWIYKRNERNPADFYSATLVLIELRRSRNVFYFRTAPIHESCSNRSGSS